MNTAISEVAEIPDKYELDQIRIADHEVRPIEKPHAVEPFLREGLVDLPEDDTDVLPEGCLGDVPEGKYGVGRPNLLTFPIPVPPFVKHVDCQYNQSDECKCDGKRMKAP